MRRQPVVYPFGWPQRQHQQSSSRDLIPGDPVEQVRAPQVFNLIFKALGINAVQVPPHHGEGRVLAIGTPAEISENKAVLDAYLGN